MAFGASVAISGTAVPGTGESATVVLSAYAWSAPRLVSAECEERSWTLRPVSGLSEVFVTVPLTTTGCFAVR